MEINDEARSALSDSAFSGRSRARAVAAVGHARGRVRGLPFLRPSARMKEQP